MSEEIKPEEKVEIKPEIKNEGKEENDFVKKDAYTEVREDMFKYKNQLKDTKALLSQLQAEKETAKNEALAEQGRWEELYKNSETQMQSMKTERESEKSKFVDYHKKNTLLQKLGGFKKDEYNSFINTNAIGLNEDGSVNEDDINNEIDRIRQSYPELLKKGTSQRLPNEAPQTNNIGERGYNDLSNDEKVNYKKQLLKRPEGF